ncbi:MAG: response regulator [Chloroflexaceae bacterium]|nr:response regulator [Chloroflexaceae bacterium]NJL35000.1 response regulator [Chloroflexaceae bacterium]NJO07973.1 response regulator [Chloroflexaceae bacterium]
MQLSSNKTAQRTLRFLLIEDDKTVVYILQTAFSLLDVPYTASSVESAEEGLKLIEQDSWDILLTDYNLPGMNGLELILHLQMRNIALPTIMLSAYDSFELRHRVKQIGVRKYLPKPFDVEEVLDAMRDLLAL